MLVLCGFLLVFAVDCKISFMQLSSYMKHGRKSGVGVHGVYTIYTSHTFEGGYMVDSLVK